MHMIILPIHLNQRGLKVLADFFKNLPERGQMLLFKDATPIFCDKDQMHMKIKNTVPACSNFA